MEFDSTHRSQHSSTIRFPSQTSCYQGGKWKTLQLHIRRGPRGEIFWESVQVLVALGMTRHSRHMNKLAWRPVRNLINNQRHVIISSSYINRCIARNDSRIERREAVNFCCRVVSSIIDLKWNEDISIGIAHIAVPPCRRTSWSSPITTHQIERKLTRRRELNVSARVVSSTHVLLSDVNIDLINIHSWWGEKSYSNSKFFKSLTYGC